MIEITNLAPHDPLPAGPRRFVTVLRRLREDDPDGTEVQIVLSGAKGDETTHPRRPDGSPMHLDEAIAAAKRVAESEGLKTVYVLDRTQGAREQDILRHGGDHSVHMAKLSDTDEEDGEKGPDMRDIAHPSS